MDIVDDHRPNGLTAVGLLEQIARQRCSSDLGNVFMLAKRGDLILIETAKVEAVLQRNHAKC